jgi:Tol biopolymer transport system component
MNKKPSLRLPAPRVWQSGLAGLGVLLAALAVVFILNTGRLNLSVALVEKASTPVAAFTAPPQIFTATFTLPPPATVEPTLTPSATPSPEPSATPTFTPLPTVDASIGGGSGVIVFTSDRDGNQEIYRMRLDGTELQRLTFSEADDRSPAFSPDGQLIAFMSWRDGLRPDIHVMNADGTQRLRVTFDEAYDEFPAWGRDGWLYFDSNRAGPFQLFRMRADGNEVQPLFLSGADDAVMDVLGQRVVFQSRRESESYQIFTSNLDGTNAVRLTHTLARNNRPEWSPDGTRIIFVSERDGEAALYVMNTDGTNQQRLTVSLGGVAAPRWSPDGQWILFAATPRGNTDLFVIRADGTDLRQLTFGPANSSSADWQP